MSSVYFIGDTHFGHKNIINFGRNFSTVEEHDEALIQYWNETVHPKDVVWHMGDVAFTTEGLLLMKKCNGRKNLILGNHDKYPAELYRLYFENIYGVVKKYDGMVLSHVPVHPSQLEYRWTANIHGHIHQPEKYILGDKYINVCADVIGLRPIHLDQVREQNNRIDKGIV